MQGGGGGGREEGPGGSRAPGAAAPGAPGAAAPGEGSTLLTLSHMPANPKLVPPCHHTFRGFAHILLHLEEEAGRLTHACAC